MEDIQNDQSQIAVVDPPEAVVENPDGEPVETGIPDEVREQIKGEPGPANEELRAKALDPNEASADVTQDPVPAVEEGVVVAEDTPDPDAPDTGDIAAAPEAEQMESDPPHEPGEDAADPLDDVQDGEVVTVSDDESEG